MPLIHDPRRIETMQATASRLLRDHGSRLTHQSRSWLRAAAKFDPQGHHEPKALKDVEAHIKTAQREVDNF